MLSDLEGHRFVGWISNESLIGDAYNFDSAVNDNVNLYAKWTNVYTVTYVLYDDVKIIEIKEENEILAKPSDPVRPGYSFDGWYANTQVMVLIMSGNLATRSREKRQFMLTGLKCLMLR